MLHQLVLVNLRILTRLLVQKELQGQEQECREFRNLNVRFMIFRQENDVLETSYCNNEKIFNETV